MFCDNCWKELSNYESEEPQFFYLGDGPYCEECYNRYMDRELDGDNE